MTRLALSRFLTPLALAGLLAGCGGQLDDNRYPTGSRSVVASADYQVLHAVDTDGGRIASHDLQSGTTQLVEVGDRPVRIVRSGDRILATLRGERAIAVLEEGPSGLELTDTVSTGAIYSGVLPFVFIQLLLLVLMWWWPNLVLWLPGVMGR